MKKICIIGGCGHVGIPLGLALASKKFNVTLIDINKKAVDKINSKKPPFKEEGAEKLLNKHAGKSLFATTDINEVKKQDVVVFVTGTPVDEHNNPKINDILRIIKLYLPLMRKGQLIILRSTIFPGTTDFIDEIFRKEFGSVKLAFCPERIAQGQGIKEINKLPQIISATSKIARKEANEIFLKIAKKTIQLEPQEAELAKLMTNTWRYIEFAIANQFYMMAENKGFDFYKIFKAMTDDYPRAKNFAKAGLTAGPCLLKDAMQLSVFYGDKFFLGQSALLVNEGLPDFLVKQLERKMGNLKNKNIVLLGLTFKPNSDDIRESLSYKIKKELEFKMAKVLMVDPYIEGTLTLSEAVKKADGFILATPHDEFKSLKIKKPFVDCWNVWG